VSVGCRAAAEMMTPYHTGKSSAFAHAGDIDIALAIEDVDQNLGSNFQFARAVARCGFSLPFGRLLRGCFRLFAALTVCGYFQRNLADELHRWQIMLGKMSLHRLADVLTLHELDQPDLRGFVTFFRSALELRDHARPGLKHRNRMHIALVVIDLGHADFFT